MMVYNLFRFYLLAVIRLKKTLLKTKPAPYPADRDKTQYIITGADGFIGREISSQLREQGYPVRGLVLGRGPFVPMPDGVELVTGDVLEPGSLDVLFSGIDPKSSVIIHTAGVISVRKT